MKRKELAALLLVGVMISGIVAAAATEAGSSGDPFLSLDWLRNTFIPNAVESAGEIIDNRFDDLTDEMLASGTVGTELRVKRGDVLQLETGSQFMLLAGNVSIVVHGAIVDMTAGNEIHDNCDATVNYRYLVAENSKSSFSVQEPAGPSLLPISFTSKKRTVSISFLNTPVCSNRFLSSAIILQPLFPGSFPFPECILHYFFRGSYLFITTSLAL